MRAKVVILLISILFLLGAFIAFEAVKAQSRPAQRSAGLQVQNAAGEIESLLRQFLAGVDTPAAHDRFWSKELIYTSASGVVRTKDEIMKSVAEGENKPKDVNEPRITYDAQDVKVKDYGDYAVLNFQLVANTTRDGKTETGNYRNTGTLHKENGEWKVIAWQATKIGPQKE